MNTINKELLQAYEAPSQIVVHLKLKSGTCLVASAGQILS